MAYRWGFKTEAEVLATEQRRELGLEVTDRFDPFALADHLAIPVISFAECARRMGGSSSSVSHVGLLHKHVSAVTAFRGRRRIILFNDSSVPARRRSDLSHELSHTLLEHPPTLLHDPARYQPNADLEDEAEFLGGALLVPRAGALELMAKGMSTSDVADHYGVSLQMARWRVRGTGIVKQLERRRRLSS
jgi:hypothetical protein